MLNRRARRVTGWLARAAEVRGEPPRLRSARQPSTTSSSGQTARSGSHGSVSASMPEAVATASPTSRRGGVPPREHVPAGSTAAGRASAPSRARARDDLGANGSSRVRDQVAQGVDEPVGALGSVNVEHRPWLRYQMARRSAHSAPCCCPTAIARCASARARSSTASCSACARPGPAAGPRSRGASRSTASATASC